MGGSSSAIRWVWFIEPDLADTARFVRTIRNRCPIPAAAVAIRHRPSKYGTASMPILHQSALERGVLILERLPSVKARTGLSRSEIYRRIAAGDFPHPVKLGERASAWSATEVDRWIAGRIAARDAKTAA
jgi:prophage regulatory protein